MQKILLTESIKRTRNSQNPTVYGLQAVSNIRQSTSKQDRHRVGNIRPGHFLVELHGNDPTPISGRGQAPISLPLLILRKDGSVRRWRRAGGTKGEETAGRCKENGMTVGVVVVAEEGGGEPDSGRKHHWRIVTEN